MRPIHLRLAVRLRQASSVKSRTGRRAATGPLHLPRRRHFETLYARDRRRWRALRVGLPGAPEARWRRGRGPGRGASRAASARSLGRRQAVRFMNSARGPTARTSRAAARRLPSRETASARRSAAAFDAPSTWLGPGRPVRVDGRHRRTCPGAHDRARCRATSARPRATSTGGARRRYLRSPAARGSSALLPPRTRSAWWTRPSRGDAELTLETLQLIPTGGGGGGPPSVACARDRGAGRRGIGRLFV